MMDLRGLKGGDKIMASQVELNDGVLLVRAPSAAAARRLCHPRLLCRLSPSPSVPCLFHVAEKQGS
jgi:hypothetical protein